MSSTCLQSWPEPIVRVQTLSESGLRAIPERYIKPPCHRPAPRSSALTLSKSIEVVNIPVVDFQKAFSPNKAVREETLHFMSRACREWGFFQVVNHGVSHELTRSTREMWRDFFYQPLDVKQNYANDPSTYEGYGSRLGVEKGAVLDWSDYFFLHCLPASLRNPNKWPATPTSCRELVAEYSNELVKFGGKLMKVLSTNLGLEENSLQDAFGGSENFGACLRVNFYPKCPQPDLTLGLSQHRDPGGLTILLPDENVAGLQVRLGDNWVTVDPAPNAFVINIGDQIQVLSNGIYKSVEHRVIVNSNQERLSLALFYNPKSDLTIQPSKQLVTEDRPAQYQPMTFDEYRLCIRRNGLCGKQETE